MFTIFLSATYDEIVNIRKSCFRHDSNSDSALILTVILILILTQIISAQLSSRT